MLLGVLLLIAFWNYQKTGKEVATQRSDAVAGLIVSPSFVDTGMKAVIFEDGKAYAYRRVGSEGRSDYRFASFQMTDEELERLHESFREHGFFELPQRLVENSTDGTTVWIMLADVRKGHQVYNYQVENDDLRAIQHEFEAVLQRQWDDRSDEGGPKAPDELSAVQLLSNVSRRIQRMPNNSPKRKLAEAWLDYAARDMASHRLAEYKSLKPFFAPEGSPILRLAEPE